MGGGGGGCWILFATESACWHLFLIKIKDITKKVLNKVSSRVRVGVEKALFSQ